MVPGFGVEGLGFRILGLSAELRTSWEQGSGVEGLGFRV